MQQNDRDINIDIRVSIVLSILLFWYFNGQVLIMSDSGSESLTSKACKRRRKWSSRMRTKALMMPRRAPWWTSRRSCNDRLIYGGVIIH